MALQRLKEEAEKAKKELSSAQSTDINLPFITADASGPKHLQVTLTRAKLEELVGDLIDRSMEPCKSALKDAGVSASEIDEIVLVGGQTRMPKVQEAVKKFFNKEPNKGVDPDEVVAIGAATQGGILKGDVKDVLLLDVTPLSLGIETLGGVFTTLIERNTTIPTKKSQIFSTAEDNQTAVTVRVFQGERPMASDNKLLSQFDLTDIAPAPRGMPQVEVTFDIDANGIVHVSAKDKGTGKEQSVQVKSDGGLSDNDVNRMVKEAEQNADSDKDRKDSVEAKNTAESTVHSVEKSLSEHGDKVDDSIKSEIETNITTLKELLEKEDASSDDLKEKTDALIQASMKLGEAIYKAQQAKEQANTETASSEQAAGDEASNDDNVVDAEYEDVEDNDKK